MPSQLLERQTAILEEIERDRLIRRGSGASGWSLGWLNGLAFPWAFRRGSRLGLRRAV